MKTLVAIGGGELRKLETLPIDQEIVRLTKKKHPKVLFIPTASHESLGYIELFNDVYGNQLGCVVDTLYLLESNNPKQIQEQILSADLIYIGGGDTSFMMKIWYEHQVDRLLKEAYESGIVLAGLSAGAICFFESGYSDSQSFEKEEWEFSFVQGLGLIKGCVCPHYNEEGRESFDERITPLEVGIALENNVAYVLNGDSIFLLKSHPDCNAYRLFQGQKVKLI